MTVSVLERACYSRDNFRAHIVNFRKKNKNDTRRTITVSVQFSATRRSPQPLFIRYVAEAGVAEAGGDILRRYKANNNLQPIRSTTILFFFCSSTGANTTI